MSLRRNYKPETNRESTNHGSQMEDSILPELIPAQTSRQFSASDQKQYALLNKIWKCEP